ncbi:hypothetical protein U6A24_12630 [Aquimarina gracilis]|uniref:Uncharacterized protein n=1 Tax=Aquimarina gracilis TaxID=874422 RepID=A0ABU5ZWQ3_9FLAO|nr:hypothetical protein [Aquimarina gracilis]MEB3346315.1 hypothetical protein [Aquimarina gracilis]
MAKTITIQGSNPIAENERANALQYMQDHLTDDELNKLYQLSKSDKSRKALQTNWTTIKIAFM